MWYMKIHYLSRITCSLAIASFFLSGCNNFNTNNLETKRFEKELFSYSEINSEESDILLEKYPDFFPVFCSDIITVGPHKSPRTLESLSQFIKDPVILRIYNMVDSIFEDFNSSSKEIKAGLEKYNKLMERSDTIQVLTFISGFNQSFVSLPGILGISLDNFMGSETDFYKQLAIPSYQRLTMNPENISINAVRAWIMSEFNDTQHISTLLDNMIQEGKILYLLSESMSRSDEHEIFNYSGEQLKWCEEYESTMWEYLIENELLYSADRVLISRMTKDAPFVREFSQNSPGKAGSWLGFRIVNSFMKKTRLSALELIEITDARRILADSRYRPG